MRVLYKLYINMAPDVNIKLNIETGDGISQAIDRQLDNELGVDVKLGLKEWNCVFDIVKADKATQQKQYSGADNDITKNNNYIVQQGVYEITKNAWTQIVQIAKQKMGITDSAPDSEEVPVAEGTTPVAEEKPEAKDVVVKMLQEEGIELSESDIDDIAAKYNAISKYYSDNNLEKDARGLTVEDRILNYAKGVAAHKLEAQFAEQYQNDVESSDLKFVNSDVEQAIADGDMDAFKAAFHQSAREYVELYDSAEGDGAIDVNELVEMEEKELGRALTAEEKELVNSLAINRMAVLDINENNKIDESEVAAYLWAMSRINDENGKSTGADITYSEWVTAQESMGILGLENPTQEEIDKYAKFNQALRNGYEGLK